MFMLANYELKTIMKILKTFTEIANDRHKHVSTNLLSYDEHYAIHI